MNAEQMVRHLTDTFRMALKELEVDNCAGFLNGPFGRFLVLYLPVRWPKGYPTLPELEPHACLRLIAILSRTSQSYCYR